MKLVMGPILKFNGVRDQQWHVSVLIVVADDSTPTLRYEAEGEAKSDSVEATVLKSFRGRTVYRYEFNVPQINDDRKVQYAVNDDWDHAYVFTVSKLGAPPRMAYASCNGFHSYADMKKVGDRANERWSNLAVKHQERSYHLLLMGGDQFYGDAMWEQLSSLRKWLDLRRKKRLAASFTGEMERQVETFYFDNYCRRWSQPEPAKMFASIATLMMWDDHDIFDGWGSYDDELQNCNVYKGIFRHAREQFSIFQLHQRPGDFPPGTIDNQPAYSYGFQIGSLGIVALDTRSQRSEEAIMTHRSLTNVLLWIDSLADITHLIVMTSIPLMYPSFGMMETALGWLPGDQELEDDLRDHWTSRPHREERLRLIHRLLSFARKTDRRCRVTVVSGDVHLAALGVIECKRDGQASDNTQVINQLISSAIVNIPPPGVARFFLKMIGGRTDHLDRGITGRMLDFPGSDRWFVAARNWLSLRPDDRDRIWAEWFVEGQQHPYTKVIHPPS